MARKRKNEEVSLDMTPMIDVVFQLIIFFVVTLKMSDDKDMSVELADGKNGIEITQDQLPPSNIQIDISESGRISVNNITLTLKQLDQRVREKCAKFGTRDIPVMIRADVRTRHKHVADVMNTCAAAGVWKLSFVAVHERKVSQPR